MLAAPSPPCQRTVLFVLFWDKFLLHIPGWSWTCGQSFCLCLSSAEVASMCHHSQLYRLFCVFILFSTLIQTSRAGLIYDCEMKMPRQSQHRLFRRWRHRQKLVYFWSISFSLWIIMSLSFYPDNQVLEDALACQWGAAAHILALQRSALVRSPVTHNLQLLKAGGAGELSATIRMFSLLFFCTLSIPSLLLSRPLSLVTWGQGLTLQCWPLIILGQAGLELRGNRCQPAP